MSFVTTKDSVQIFYKDWGPKEAQPIVFHHGWPLSADDWDNHQSESSLSELAGRCDGSEKSAWMPNGSGLKSSVTLGNRMQRPSSNSSCMKSIDQTSLQISGTVKREPIGCGA